MKMKIVSGVVISILAITGFARAQGASKESPAVQQHIAKAMEYAGTRYHDAAARLCSPPNNRPRPAFDNPVPAQDSFPILAPGGGTDAERRGKRADYPYRPRHAASRGSALMAAS